MSTLRQSVITTVVCACLASGCTKKTPEPSSSAATGEAPTVPADSPASPIKSTLRKAGMDPRPVQPLESTEQYVAFLERPDRAIWQKPDDVVRALGLTGDETVADVGADSGYFSFRFAAALPRGRVVATDIEPEMIRYIRQKAMTQRIPNVEPVLASADDPKVPDTADLVFVCDILRRIDDRSAWLLRLHEEMKPGARLVLIEFKEGDLPEGPPATLKIPRSDLFSLLQTAGFTPMAEEPDLLPYQLFLVFRK
ncbi:MAG: methyltransferase [Sedimentisphaerales bacterium]|nr:methyltransferase [Sedimentisphaerales bacterium]